MLAEKTTPTSHAGEDQSSGALTVRSAYIASALAGVQAAQAGAEAAQAAAPRLSYFINRPEVDADTLSELIIGNDWLRPGDIIHVAEIRRYTLINDDLNAAARAVIGGAV